MASSIRLLTRAGRPSGPAVGESGPLPTACTRFVHANYAGASVTVLGRHARECEQFGWWRGHFPTSGGNAGKPADCRHFFPSWCDKRVEKVRGCLMRGIAILDAPKRPIILYFGSASFPLYIANDLVFFCRIFAGRRCIHRAYPEY